VTISSLQAGSTYYYKVGDPTKANGVSAVFHFKVLFCVTTEIKTLICNAHIIC